MRCECGGTLQETLLASYDFSPFAGLPVVLADVPGYRCDTCGGEALPGSVIDFTLDYLAAEIVRSPERLSGDQARYLRKHLGLSQKALAERMGIYRETVAKWECGESEISPQHDYILRGLAILHLKGFADLWDELSSVRTVPPRSQRAAPLRIKEISQRMRDSEGSRRAAG
jgi:DNA-binding transcriptional regulator YiaG